MRERVDRAGHLSRVIVGRPTLELILFRNIVQRNDVTTDQHRRDGLSKLGVSDEARAKDVEILHDAV